MTDLSSPPSGRLRHQGTHRCPASGGPKLLLICAAVVLLAACGERKQDRTPTQAAARVNKDEVTVQQINLVLQQQRNLRPEQADEAGRLILERLINQALAVQKADELALDDDPRVQLQIEAARREILARAYTDKVGEAAARPTADDVRQYYQAKPALFRERRIYSIQEIAVEARPEQVPVLREQLGAARSITDFVDGLKAQDYRFAANHAVRAAEQLPMHALETLSKMSDGQATLLQTGSGAQVVVLVGSRSQPVSEEQARPAIEQFLLNERKRKLVQDEVKALRAAARIEYLGKFADGPRPNAASAPGTGSDDLTGIGGTSGASGASGLK